LRSTQCFIPNRCKILWHGNFIKPNEIKHLRGKFPLLFFYSLKNIYTPQNPQTHTFWAVVCVRARSSRALCRVFALKPPNHGIKEFYGQNAANPLISNAFFYSRPSRTFQTLFIIYCAAPQTTPLHPLLPPIFNLTNTCKGGIMGLQ
jgi:hypothetical protein